MESEYPLASTSRVVKVAFQEKKANVTKEAKKSFNLAASFFTLYLTSAANDQCLKHKRQTISTADVFNALVDIDMTEFSEPLQQYLNEVKSKSNKKNNNPVEDMNRDSVAEENCNEMIIEKDADSAVHVNNIETPSSEIQLNEKVDSLEKMDVNAVDDVSINKKSNMVDCAENILESNGKGVKYIEKNAKDSGGSDKISVMDKNEYISTSNDTNLENIEHDNLDDKAESQGNRTMNDKGGIEERTIIRDSNDENKGSMVGNTTEITIKTKAQCLGNGNIINSNTEVINENAIVDAARVPEQEE